MALPVTGQVGVQTLGDGVATGLLRQGRLGELIQSNLHGFYYEQASRGSVYSGMLAATTTGVAAGNISGAAAAASTQFALWNPLGSGVNIALLKVFIGIISGTPPGGPLFHNLLLNGNPQNQVGTNGLNNLSQPGSSPKGRLLASAAGAALTGGGPLSPLRPMNSNFFAAALTAGSNVNGALELIDGDIVLAPGFGWVPCLAAAGTTLLNSYGVTWEEVPQ